MEKCYSLETEYYFISDINIDEYSYIKKLLKNKIIENNKIYDFNDICFIEKLNKYKKKINVYLSDELNINLEEIKLLKEKINQAPRLEKFEILFLCDCIINDWLYCDLNGGNRYYDIKKIRKFLKTDKYDDDDLLSVSEINGSYYDNLYLRKYIPYLISWDEKYFVIQNRDYEYINFGKELPNNFPKSVIKNSECMFNDGMICWTNNKKRNNQNIQNIINKFNIIKQNKICLNLNEITQKLLLQ